jgi:putative addiction module component (TIGR02574 family)
VSMTPSTSSGQFSSEGPEEDRGEEVSTGSRVTATSACRKLRVMAGRAQIMDEALELPADERAELAAKLLDSLEPMADARLSEPWEREIRARVRRVLSGDAQSSPWAEVRERLLSRRSARA